MTGNRRQTTTGERVMLNNTCAFALGIMVAVSGLALASEVRYERSFSDLDMDENGLISRAEAVISEPLRHSWRQLDRNRDDLLDPAEFGRFDAQTVEPVSNAAWTAPIKR